MQAAPPPSAQVLPDAASPVSPRRVSIAVGPPVAEPAPASPQPAQVSLRRPFQDRPQAATQPVILTQPSSAETADATLAPPQSDLEIDAGGANATAIPRRPVIDESGRSRSDVPWLGIASWLLLCVALFASLVGWPSPTALDRVTALWSSGAPGTTEVGRPAPTEPTPDAGAPLPSHEQDWSAVTPGAPKDLPTLPPTELAPPIRSDPSSDAVERAPGGPPLPQFKPRVDRVAAKFSNAFFEIGDRLQQQGDFDAALHMRRQGINLNPWKGPGGSEL